jgi:hypothetical protein
MPRPSCAGSPTAFGESSRSKTRGPARRRGPRNRPLSFSDRTAQLEAQEGPGFCKPTARESTTAWKRQPPAGERCCGLGWWRDALGPCCPGVGRLAPSHPCGFGNRSPLNPLSGRTYATASTLVDHPPRYRNHQRRTRPPMGHGFCRGKLEMRFAMLLLVGSCLISPVTTMPAHATPLQSLGIETEARAFVEVAGPRCGRYSHYVRGHRARNGRWIRGHCVRNRHR